MRDFSGWFQSPLGSLVLEQETRLLLHAARRFHGDTLLWLGPVRASALHLERCMVRHRIFGAIATDAVTGTDEHLSSYLGTPEQLPFATGALDAVVVHHALEMLVDQRAAVREISRVLRPGGFVLFCTFNPYSLLGMRCMGARFGNGPLAGLKPLSPLRLLDWLALLDLELEQAVDYLMFRPPIDNRGSYGPFWQSVGTKLADWRIPFGGVYLVMARKAALGMLPRQPKGSRLRRQGFQPIPVPKPSVRQSQRTQAPQILDTAP